ncbi:kinesin-like protein [Pycnococcus provasolii]
MPRPSGGGGSSKDANAGGSECVRVVVRCRPLNSKEKEDGRKRVVDMDTKAGTVVLKNPKADAAEPPKQFTFDLVYDWNCKQADIFNEVGMPLVNSALEGYNGTMFAYGQTGTGKTHTMVGVNDNEELMGIIPRVFRSIFKAIEEDPGTHNFLVRTSFLEIYNEDVRDLLGRNSTAKLDLKETPDTGVYVKDLTNFVVKSEKEMHSVLGVGNKNRTVGATLMNQDSSRSHSIFTITVECSDRADSGKIRVGKLNLVDLAGSERQSKTGATGERLKEATKINLSLSALGNVISALVDGKSSHIPYRDSKLTRLLQDSLGGNTKTCMVANTGPADYNYDETLSTLRYANRAKNIKNKPRINEDPKDAMLREFQNEIAKLKAQVEAGGGGGGGGGVRRVEKVVEKDVSEETLARIREQMRADMEKGLAEGVTEEEAKRIQAEAEANAKAEMELALRDKKTTEKQRRAIQEALDARAYEASAAERELEEERQRQAELERRLKAMEGNVLGKSEEEARRLGDDLERAEEEKARIKALMEEQKRKEEEDAERRRELEEAALMAEEHYASIQEEAEMKTKKLKKLYSRYQQAQSDLTEVAEECQQERERMLEDIRNLTQQIKLRDLIIGSYIPEDFQTVLLSRMQWDEGEEEWLVQHDEICGVAKKKQREAHFKQIDAHQSAIAKATGTSAEDMRVVAGIEEAFGPGAATQIAGKNNIFFTYEDDGQGADGAAAPAAAEKPKRPSSARKKSVRPSSGRKGSKGADPTKQLGDVRQMVAEEQQESLYPKARGIVDGTGRRGR